MPAISECFGIAALAEQRWSSETYRIDHGKAALHTQEFAVLLPYEGLSSNPLKNSKS